MNLGTALKALRKLRKMSQTDLANVSGLSVSYISLLERNKRDPTMSSLQRIANALDVSLFEMIAVASPDEMASSIQARVLGRRETKVIDLGRKPQPW